MNKPIQDLPARRQHEARALAEKVHFKCCAVCGFNHKAALGLSHLDGKRENNDADNLAWLCDTHHTMLDVGMYPIAAIKLLRDHWNEKRGEPDHRLRMKDAAKKAGRKRSRKAAARKAVRTMRLRGILPPESN
jgi:hypothetical protein